MIALFLYVPFWWSLPKGFWKINYTVTMSKITTRKHFKAPEPDIAQLFYLLYWGEVWKGTSPFASLSLALLAGEELRHFLALSGQDNQRPEHREYTTPRGPLRYTCVSNISFSLYLETPWKNCKLMQCALPLQKFFY